MKEFRLSRACLMKYKDGQTRPQRRKAGHKEPGALRHQDLPSSSSSSSSSTSETSPSEDIQRIPQVPVVPHIKDERGWRTLIYGAGTAKQEPSASTSAEMSLVGSKQGESSMDSIQTQATTSETSSIPDNQGKPPTPQFLMKLNQGHLIVLLRFFLRWLAENDVTEQEVTWNTTVGFCRIFFSRAKKLKTCVDPLFTWYIHTCVF